MQLPVQDAALLPDTSSFLLLQTLEELSPCPITALPIRLLSKGLFDLGSIASDYLRFRQFLADTFTQFQEQGLIRVGPEFIYVTPRGRDLLRAVGDIRSSSADQQNGSARMSLLSRQAPSPSMRDDLIPSERSAVIGRALTTPVPAQSGECAMALAADAPLTLNSESWCVAENIPRRMRVRVPQEVDIRLAANLASIGGRSVTSAVTLRLAAPKGGFIIEPKSPETQRIGLDYRHTELKSLPWRFVVTPVRHGTSVLQISFSLKQLNPGGLLSRQGMPELVYEIRVRKNASRLCVWTLGGVAVLFVGILMGIHLPALLAGEPLSFFGP